MSSLLLAVAASIIATAIVAVFRRPIGKLTRRVRDFVGFFWQCRRRLRKAEDRCARLTDALKQVREVLLHVDATAIPCDLDKVRCEVNTKRLWEGSSPMVLGIDPSRNIVRVDKGANHGVLPGMVVRISRLSGGQHEDYHLRTPDIDESYVCIQPLTLDLTKSHPGEIQASFVSIGSLNESEKILALLLDLVEDALLP